MNHQEFQVSRQQLGKTQKQLSELLGTSLKAVQSFEQKWRKVPVHIERQMLFLLTSKKGKAKEVRPCWEIQTAPRKGARVVRPGNLMRATSAGLSMGPFARGEFGPAGAAR